MQELASPPRGEIAADDWIDQATASARRGRLGFRRSSFISGLLQRPDNGRVCECRRQAAAFASTRAYRPAGCLLPGPTLPSLDGLAAAGLLLDTAPEPVVTPLFMVRGAVAPGPISLVDAQR